MYTITQSRLLYVLSINDRIHRGLLKIGEVFVDNEVADNPSQHAKTVREILNERPYMLGITYNLEYVECTTYEDTECYDAYKVHCKLHAMGFLSKLLPSIKILFMSRQRMLIFGLHAQSVKYSKLFNR